MDHMPSWMHNLDNEDLNFIHRFILSSGSLKEIAKEYGVTYPTVRLRLDRLINKVNETDALDQDSYIAIIKNLALQNQIDYLAAKTLIDEYRKIKEN